MLILTDQAATVIEGILTESQAGPDGGLRISGKEEPNGAASLEFALTPEPTAGDAVVEEGGARVFLDDVAATVLDDKTLDVQSHEDHLHFQLGDQEEVP